MQREKSGGHSERSNRHRDHRWSRSGTQSPRSPENRSNRLLPRALQTRAQDRQQSVAAIVGGADWYAPGQERKRFYKTRCGRHLDSGYTMVKIKIGGLAARRGRAAGGKQSKRCLPAYAQLAVDAELQIRAPRRGIRLRAGAGAIFGCAGSIRGLAIRSIINLLAEIAARYPPPLSRTGKIFFPTQDVEKPRAFRRLDIRSATM